jgi:signal transduction histidine kinase
MRKPMTECFLHAGSRQRAGNLDEQRLTLVPLSRRQRHQTDTGKVRITATALISQFTVCVADTGPGIPLDELKRVFEQFHQIDSANTMVKGGTGFGLAIANEIVAIARRAHVATHGGRF